MAWNCAAFNDILLDQSPHFLDKILKDWFPTDDAWIGHVATETWEAFSGTTKVYDHVHVGAPDLSQAWDAVNLQDSGCIDGACDSHAICVGWGETRKSYGLEQKTYQTNVLCFDQIDSKAKAKQLVAEIIKGIHEITKMVWSDYHRRNALMLNQTLWICGSAGLSMTVNAGMFTGGMATIDIGGAANLPTSNLTIQYLQRFYAGLQGQGYFKSKFVPNGVFKLITDEVTSNQLIEQNPTLQSMYRFDDFQKGGQLFKYGMSKAIGNFGIAWDSWPARFYWNPNTLVLDRVWPYVNAAATIGIRPTWNQQYELAPYQLSYVWHPEAMIRAVPTLESVNPEMPFMTRNLNGQWNFTGGNRDKTFVVTDPLTGETCTIDNKKGNKGFLWADFRSGFRFEYPEWTRPILHLREPGCVVDQVPCSTAPDYVTQDWGDCNPVCLE